MLWILSSYPVFAGAWNGGRSVKDLPIYKKAADPAIRFPIHGQCETIFLSFED
jgi:hypothetical protein